MRFDRYNRIVAHYPSMWPLLVPGYVPILNTMLDVVRTLDTKPSEILDMGSGPGTATVAVAPGSDPEGVVTLVDGSKPMLDEAKRMLGDHVKVTFQGDFADLAILRDACPVGSYNLALCSFALHHLADVDKRLVVEHIGASLKLGGLLLLADEVAVDRPAGWDVVERIRARILEGHLRAGRISQEFWDLETSLSAEAVLPFLPARIEDMTSWMARAGLAVSCPVTVLGSSLLIGIKAREQH